MVSCKIVAVTRVDFNRAATNGIHCINSWQRTILLRNLYFQSLHDTPSPPSPPPPHTLRRVVGGVCYWVLHGKKTTVLERRLGRKWTPCYDHNALKSAHLRRRFQLVEEEIDLPSSLSLQLRCPRGGSSLPGDVPNVPSLRRSNRSRIIKRIKERHGQSSRHMQEPLL